MFPFQKCSEIQNSSVWIVCGHVVYMHWAHLWRFLQLNEAEERNREAQLQREGRAKKTLLLGAPPPSKPAAISGINDYSNLNDADPA